MPPGRLPLSAVLTPSPPLAATRLGSHAVGRTDTEVWGYEAYPTTRTVDNHILKLRKKLEDDPVAPRYILSIYGQGYKFIG